MIKGSWMRYKEKDTSVIGHSKWIPINSKYWHYECQNCSKQVANKMDTCPKCGANMREDDSAFRKRAEMELMESCYLEQGITQGIV